MTLSRIAALVLAGIPLTACISTEPLPTHDYGFVVLVAEPDGAGGTLVNEPLGYFVRTQQLGVTTQGATRDSCATGPLSQSTGPTPGLPYVDGGAAVTVSTPDGPITLQRDATQSGLLVYRAAGSYPFTPGGAISATVPGADGGFPTMTVEGTAAAAFTFQPVPVGEAPATDIQLTWTPAPEAGKTTMNVSLRYAQDGTELDTQIFCTLVDDGQYTVNKLIAEGWNTTEGERDALFERSRVSLEDAPETESTLLLYSTYLQSDPAPAP